METTSGADGRDGGGERATGFHSLVDELTATPPVTGSIPSWLSGSLIRNGPGAFELGGARVDHWFDGLAMLRRFGFDDGRVTYRNRFLRGDTYWRARTGRFDGGFATGSSTLRERLASFAFGPGYDNANVIAERVGDAYLALTETPRPVAFDPRTLATVGTPTVDTAAQVTCAHLKRDPATDALVTVDTSFGRTSAYEVVELDGPRRRRRVATVSVDRPSYMHSFALTPSYVVLTEFPFTLDPTTFLEPGRIDGFVDAYDWQPARGTRFTVVDRATGDVLGRPVTDPFFGFHHVNAYEADGDVVVDLETVPDAESVGALDLSRLRAGDVDAAAGRLERFRVRDPDGSGTPRVERTTLYDDGTALPTASRDRWLRRHRYVYAQSSDQPVTDWPRALLRFDVETGAVREFDERDYGRAAYFGEPTFVPRPGGDREDDGVLLTEALEPDAGRSTIVVLDAADMTELARAPLPHALPFGFHGRWFPEL